MKWWIIPAMVLYFAIGNWFADTVKEGDDSTRLVLFICWPLIAALLIAAFAVMCATILVVWVIAIIKYLLGGFDNGVV